MCESSIRNPRVSPSSVFWTRTLYKVIRNPSRSLTSRKEEVQKQQTSLNVPIFSISPAALCRTWFELLKWQGRKRETSVVTDRRKGSTQFKVATQERILAFPQNSSYSNISIISYSSSSYSFYLFSTLLRRDSSESSSSSWKIHKNRRETRLRFG